MNARGEEKDATYPGQLILELKPFLHLLNDVKKINQAMKVVVYKDYNLISKMFQGKRYCSLHRVIDEIVLVKTGVNVLSDTFDLFVLKFEFILDFLGIASKSLVSRRLFLGDYEGVMVYHFRVGNEKGGYVSHHLYYTKNLAFEAGKRYKEENQSEGTLKAVAMPSCCPDPVEMMRVVYLKMVYVAVKKAAVNSCDGCVLGRPKDHVDHGFDTGCQARLEQKVANYHQSVYVCPAEVSQMFDTMRRVMGARPMLSLYLAKAAKGYISSEEITDFVNRKDELQVKRLSLLFNSLLRM